MSSKLKKLNRQSIYPPPPPPPRFFSLINKLSKTPLHDGFSLIEVLITATVGLILGAGVLKLSQVAIQNTNIVQTSLVESELKRAIDKFLNDPDNPTQCQDVLGPFHASDLSASPVSVYPQTPVPTADPAKTAYEKLGKLAGETGLISIEKIELKDKSDPVRQFIVYYKKPRLGKYETIGGGRCTGGTAAGDQNGCYFVSCDIKYRCSNADCDGKGADTDPAVTDDDDIKCQLIKCEGTGKSLSDVGECGDNEHLKGFDSTGNPICQQNCTGGRQWDESTTPPGCGCPANTRWNDIFRRCTFCQPHQRLGSDGNCVDVCPPSSTEIRQVWNGMQCICPFTTVVNNKGDCVCPQSEFISVQPSWDSGLQKCQCPQNNTRKYFNGRKCTTCPNGQHRRGDADSMDPNPNRCLAYNSIGEGINPVAGKIYCKKRNTIKYLYDLETKSCWPNPMQNGIYMGEHAGHTSWTGQPSF